MFDAQYVLDNGGFGTPTQFNSNFNQKPIPGSGPYVVTHVSENELRTIRAEIQIIGARTSHRLILPSSRFLIRDMRRM